MTRPVAWVGVVLIGLAPARVCAQEVFHSGHVANLPTAATLPAGSWLFEVSHRFDTPVSRGGEALWGLDGPAVLRLGLSYSVTGALTLGVLRTNLQDNLELNGRLKLLEGRVGSVPLEAALKGGGAWNMEVTERSTHGGKDNEFQLYAQLVLNAMLGGRFAVGVVPSYLRNPRIRDFDKKNAWALGIAGQAYLTGSASLFGEWLFAERRPDLGHDAGTFGLELETRGHFFKLLVTNQARINPTQFLGGSAVPFEVDELRLGFNITRLLPF